MSKQVTITLSDEQLVQLNAIHSTRKDRTQAELLTLVIERGIYALEYRTKYNKVKYANTKAAMAEFRAFKAMRKEAIAEEEVAD